MGRRGVADGVRAYARRGPSWRGSRRRCPAFSSLCSRIQHGSATVRPLRQHQLGDASVTLDGVEDFEIDRIEFRNAVLSIHLTHLYQSNFWPVACSVVSADRNMIRSRPPSPFLRKRRATDTFCRVCRIRDTLFSPWLPAALPVKSLKNSDKYLGLPGRQLA